MAEISGKMYLIIGAGIGVLSIGVNISRRDTSFTVFAIIGVLMFLWGLYKVISQKKDTHKLHDKHLRNQHNKKGHMHQHHKGAYATPHHGDQKNHPYYPKRHCPKCKNALAQYDNFCSNCGFRLR